MEYLDGAISILKTLEGKGYEAYIVGGTVRDRLLNRDINDIDITTSALPDEVIKCFKNVKKTGIKYGTVSVFIDDFQYEVTTYRSDGKYINNRKPKDVSFNVTISEDVSRRDFTINGILMNKNFEYIDLVDGKVDLENKLIRAIGEPVKRFEEDSLRMLRAFYFVSKLGFDLDGSVIDAIKNVGSLINNVAVERIMVEFSKIFDNEDSLKSVSYIIETGFHKNFPSLTKGFEFINERKIKVDTVEFYIISFYLNDFTIDESLRFSNKEFQLFKSVLNLLHIINEELDDVILYANGLTNALIANRVGHLLGISANDEQTLVKKYEELPIKKTCDLVFKGQDILNLTELKNAVIIGDIVDELKFLVVSRVLQNEYEELKEHALMMIHNLEGSD